MALQQAIREAYKQAVRSGIAVAVISIRGQLFLRPATMQTTYNKVIAIVKPDGETLS